MAIDRRLQRRAGVLERANEALRADLEALQRSQQAALLRQTADTASPTRALALARLGEIATRGRTYTPTQCQVALADMAIILQRLLGAS